MFEVGKGVERVEVKMRHMEIKFENGKEVFGMSGPWLADCYLDNKKLQGKFLIDNAPFSIDESRIALSRYSDSPSYRRVFKIVVVDSMADIFYISKTDFNSLFIESVNSDSIVFYEAFHNKLPNRRRSILISLDNFFQVMPNEIYF